MLYNHSSDTTAPHFSTYDTQDMRPVQTFRPMHQDSPPLESENLLKGQKVVEIVHNGSLYKLQATKLGKLILTK